MGNETTDIVISIDASRNRSGGAKANVIGILSECNPMKYGIREIHIWTYRSLLDSIPDRPWLVKHNPKELERSLMKQIWWQATKLSVEAKSAQCDILFTTDASTLCRFKPMVVLSSDMLSYEPGVMRLFGYTKDRLRLLAILLLQNRAFRFAAGVIFLTRYAATVIQQSCGPLSHMALIPHGVGAEFKCIQRTQPWPEADDRAIRCLYVSPIWMFKNQWAVVEAIAALRKRGYNVHLSVVGDGNVKAQRKLDEQITISDPDGNFVKQLGFIPKKDIPALLAEADLFVFASSCENMPNTLIEAMATGLPIACSNRGPMPELLRDGGVFFNPEDSTSIATAIEQIIKYPELRTAISLRAKKLSGQYSWARCADDTWTFIADTYRRIKG